jgi:hypothetical protein
MWRAGEMRSRGDEEQGITTLTLHTSYFTLHTSPFILHPSYFIPDDGYLPTSPENLYSCYYWELLTLKKITP